MYNKNKRLCVYAIVLLIFLLVSHEQTANAYVNPGSGSDLFQIIYSGILSVLLFFKTIFLKIKGIFVKSDAEDNKYE